MTYTDLIVLLPCQSLESLSLHRDAAEAEELLAGWSALYHPVLIAGAERLPRWSSAEAPPELQPEMLVVVPPCVRSSLPMDWLSQAENSPAKLIQGYRNREEILAAALAGLPESPALPLALAADFLALGYGHLIVELLTRQLRYASNLDEQRLRQHLVAAAQKAVAGEEAQAREELHYAFDRLTEAREYFFPSETRLLDLTLVASTTLGSPLREQLALDRPVNLLICGEVLEEMAAREPATLEALRAAMDAGRVSLVGGEYQERELSLLPIEEILISFKRGLAAYDRHLGRRPTIFGRRRFGLTPLLPQILRKLGFDGAVHFTLDDGRFPASDQSKIRWEGLDGTEIETLTRIPLDAGHASVFLQLAERLGNMLDLDHTAATLFAHWPGQSSPWYGDLRRIVESSSALGRFATMADYFQNTMYSGRSVKFSPDKYRSPYLRQQVEAEEPDPISRWVGCHRRRARSDAAQTWNCLAQLIGGSVQSPESPPGADGMEAARSRFLQRLPHSAGGVPGLLVANPSSFVRRAVVDVSPLVPPPEATGPIISVEEAGGIRQALVEVPAMGFAWVGPGAAAAAADLSARGKKPESSLVAEDNVLRNEHFHVVVSRTTGAIQAMHNYALRGNRLAVQLGMRLSQPGKGPGRGEPGSEDEYSIMAADDVQASMPGPMVARIVARGRLMSRDGERLASYVQTYEARRGIPVLQIQTALEIDRQPGPDPWISYYALRLAWTDESAEFFRGVGLLRQATEANFLESPHYFDLRSQRARYTLLTGGLPYHRRFGFRKLDSLLCVRGETARSFRVGIAVDLLHPVPAALDFLAPETLSPEPSAPPASPSGWLFHLDSKNVIATHWEPLVRGGLLAGYRARLLETEGRSGQVGVRSFRPVVSARKVDFLDQDPAELTVDDDRVRVDMGPRQWIELEAEFATP